MNRLMETTSTGIDPMLENSLKRELLKCAAMHAVTCPKCGDNMACRRTVVVELVATTPEKAQNVLATKTLCAACWEGGKDTFMKLMKLMKEIKLDGVESVSVEVTDGREIFK